MRDEREGERKVDSHDRGQRFRRRKGRAKGSKRSAQKKGRHTVRSSGCLPSTSKSKLT